MLADLYIYIIWLPKLFSQNDELHIILKRHILEIWVKVFEHSQLISITNEFSSVA